MPFEEKNLFPNISAAKNCRPALRDAAENTCMKGKETTDAPCKTERTHYERFSRIVKELQTFAAKRLPDSATPLSQHICFFPRTANILMPNRICVITGKTKTLPPMRQRNLTVDQTDVQIKQKYWHIDPKDLPAGASDFSIIISRSCELLLQIIYPILLRPCLFLPPHMKFFPASPILSCPIEFVWSKEADCHHMKTRWQNENFFTLRISSLATTKSHYLEKIVIVRTIFSCETDVIHAAFDGCNTGSRKKKSLIRFRFQPPT